MLIISLAMFTTAGIIAQQTKKQLAKIEGGEHNA